MIAWLAQNLGTIIISLVLAAIVIMIIASMIKSRKKGTPSSCSCGCSGCSGCSHCSMSETSQHTRVE